MRWAPPMPETISRARHSVSGSVLPFSSTSPCRSNSMASPASRRVVVSTRTVPAVAADSTRAAVLTASPATIAWPSALDRGRDRAGHHAGPGGETGRRRWRLRARPPRRRAPWRHGPPARRRPRRRPGVPQTAITASPMNFSIVPPYLVTTVRAMSKYRDSSSRTSSGSRPSLSGVKPTRSTNSTEHSRRSVSGVGRAGSGRLRGCGLLDRRAALGAEAQAGLERRAARPAGGVQPVPAVAAEALTGRAVAPQLGHATAKEYAAP